MLDFLFGAFEAFENKTFDKYCSLKFSMYLWIQAKIEKSLRSLVVKLLTGTIFIVRLGLNLNKKGSVGFLMSGLSMSLFIETPNSHVHSSSIARLPKKHFKTLHEI